MRLSLFACSTLVLAASLAGCANGDVGVRPDAQVVLRDDGGASEPDAATPLDAWLDPTVDAFGLDAASPAEPDAASTTDAALVSMPCTAAGACDPFVTSGACPSGQACRETTSGTQCLDTASSVLPAGSTCATADQCAQGTMCLNFGSGFVCERLCPMGSIGACGAGYACTGTLTSGADACVQVCRPLPTPCDVYAQDCASSSDTCTLVRNAETGEAYQGCRPAGTLGDGATCGSGVGSCGHSLVCVSVGGTSTCHYLCDPDATDTCASPQTCAGRLRDWDVGYCRTP